MPVRAELKSLPLELAEQVGAHLAAAGELIADNPELALRHAQAARRRAARLTVTREALGETAYAAGEWLIALNEFRALRRMTGEQMWLPVMADCERALGRPQAVLRLVQESASLKMQSKDRVELRLVEAGARADLGQTAEALRLLRTTLAGLPVKAVGAKVRVAYALAERLLEEGQTGEAARLFAQVTVWDTDGETDSAVRSDELSGMSWEPGDDEVDDSDSGDVEDDDSDDDDVEVDDSDDDDVEVDDSDDDDVEVDDSDDDDVEVDDSDDDDVEDDDTDDDDVEDDDTDDDTDDDDVEDDDTDDDDENSEGEGDDKPGDAAGVAAAE